MRERTKKILRKATRLSWAWHDESLSACGHDELVQRALRKREKFFDFLEQEIEQLVKEAEFKDPQNDTPINSL
jgi:hypothetical protein